MRTILFCHIGMEKHSAMRVSSVLKPFLLLTSRGARAALYLSALLAQAKPDRPLSASAWLEAPLEVRLKLYIRNTEPIGLC